MLSSTSAQELQISQLSSLSEKPSTETKKRTVAYLNSPQYTTVCDLLPSNKGRASLVNGLIEAYGLTKDMKMISPLLASKSHICSYHDEEFIDFMLYAEKKLLGDKNLKNMKQEYDDEDFEELKEEFGLVDDCPIFIGLSKYIQYVAGASIMAARTLMNGNAQVAINWNGGRHHGKKAQASGYCYINDIVLAITELLKRFSRVMYIDMDLHHGDGVEEAFLFSNKVLTMSFHRFGVGFFPGTGSETSTGSGKGKNYSINIPLQPGLSGGTLKQIFHDIVTPARMNFKPQAVVVQCGADGLAGDPNKEWNLDIENFGSCLRTVLDWNTPTLLLGGGGYDHPNTARLWTYLTSLALNVSIPTTIPEHPSFGKYGPDFELMIDAGNRRDENTSDKVKDLVATGISLAEMVYAV
ncbi:hypothetical protein BKA69DRAFT_1167001 [Paraphysoderma sedebokerense]|nr:hypothetical protein BKA69DRAFT_1167001 [Paraphysoderma sedebokerense]